jgi:hypothetical protein
LPINSRATPRRSPKWSRYTILKTGEFDAAVTWWQKADSTLSAVPPTPRRCALLSLRAQNRCRMSAGALSWNSPCKSIWAALTSPLRGTRRRDCAGLQPGRRLSRQIADTPSQFRALWGGAFHFARDQHKAHEMADNA